MCLITPPSITVEIEARLRYSIRLVGLPHHYCDDGGGGAEGQLDIKVNIYSGSHIIIIIIMLIKSGLRERQRS